MSVLGTAGQIPVVGGDEELQDPATALPALMSQDEHISEKSKRTGLGAHGDARHLVRLIQCSQCSRPFRTPVTLPCGNSLCRECIPEAHEREERASWPGIPERRHAIKCPFASCGQNHIVSDFGVDVVLTKLMDSIADIVVKHTSLLNSTPTIEGDAIRWEVVTREDSEKQATNGTSGGRLVATYLLAAQGKLSYEANPDYAVDDGYFEMDAASDDGLLQDLVESANREVDCQVCYNLMLDPVTTYCGHTLCRRCMVRVLDHSLHCPVCRTKMSVSPSLATQESNKTLVSLLNSLCPETIATRQEAVAVEEFGDHGELNVPLFVCALAFPHQPTFLRIFEPRYRLMLRRCLEGNREFGMLMHNRYGEPQGDLGAVHFYHYGTMLSIIHSQILPDGTSLIETRGIYRFRVRAHGSHDGYAVGNVERLDDVSLVEEERIEAEEMSQPGSDQGEDDQAELSRMSTSDLLAVGRDFIVRMQERSAPWLQQRVLAIHGQAPEDAAVFPYWFASVLPINDEEKYKLLGTQTVRERLKITATWIRRIESQRWYQSNACRIL